MAPRKLAKASRHQNNTDPENSKESSSGNEGSSKDISKKAGESIMSKHHYTQCSAPTADTNCGDSSSITDSTKFNESVESSENPEELGAVVCDTKISNITKKCSNNANESIKLNETKPPPCLILQRLINRQNSQQKASQPRRLQNASNIWTIMWANDQTALIQQTYPPTW